jgi:hypothetical protein
LVSAWLLLLTLGLISATTDLPETFGHAHLFHPLPDTAVGAHCKWEVKLNTVTARVPFQMAVSPIHIC